MGQLEHLINAEIQNQALQLNNYANITGQICAILV